MSSSIDMTLRAVVDGKQFAKIRLPEPLELSRKEAETIAVWARPFSGTCLIDMEIHISDIRPSSALMVLSDLSKNLGKKIKPLLTEARRYGFGLRITRETASDPYEMSILRRTIDVPQLTISARSLHVFLDVLGFMNVHEAYGSNDLHESRVVIDAFEERLRTRYTQCMEAGVAHYREYCQRIVEYGVANGATEIVWGPERRGAVQPEITSQEETEATSEAEADGGDAADGHEAANDEVGTLSTAA